MCFIKITCFIHYFEIHFLFVFLYIILAVTISLIVHELGHILSTIIVGWKLYYLKIGFIELKKDTNKKLKLRLDIMGLGNGGRCASLPSIIKENNRYIYAAIIISGPLISLCYGFSSVFFTISTHNPAWSLFWGINSIVSFSIFIWTLLSKKNGKQYSDGTRFFRLIKRNKKADTEIALLNIAVALNNSKYLSNIKKEDLQLLLEDGNQTYKQYVYFFLNIINNREFSEQVPNQFQNNI